LHAVGNADAEIVGRAVLAGEVVRRRGSVDEQRVQSRHLRFDSQRSAGWIETREERNALVLDQLLGGFDGGRRLALVVLDHQFVFAPERAALRVETFNREVRAVVDEGAADRIGAGVDVDDAELDGVLGHGAAWQHEGGG
jgi:hypothetical protein